MTEAELRAAVDEIMDAEDLRLLLNRAEVVLVQVDHMIGRAEVIADLRAAHGKHLGVGIQGTLGQIAGKLEELRDALAGAS